MFKRFFRLTAIKLLCKLCLRVIGIPLSVWMQIRSILSCRPFILFQFKIGLREHVDPLIAWLLENDVRCWIIVTASPGESAQYRKISSIPYGEKRFLWLIDRRIFHAVTVFYRVFIHAHPESGHIAKYIWPVPRSRIVIQHGLSDKRVFFSKNMDNLKWCDVIFLAGPMFKSGSLKKYSETYPESFRRLKIYEVGLPKTDALFDPTFERDNYLAGLGMDPGKKTICYAPTWEREASLEQNGVEIIRTLAGIDANIIVKLHHLSASNKVIETDWVKILGDMEKAYPNLRLAKEHNANPVLMASDILVSDASGVAYEFLLLDRPVIFYDVPLLFQKYGRDGIHFWGREAGCVVKDLKQLGDVARELLAAPDFKKKERERIIDKIVYSRGKATETAGKIISEMLRS